MISTLPSGHASQVGNAPHPAPPNLSSSRGEWVGTRFYSLEVVQHPLRARMCGFGDKDRRPVAPATVVKLDVYDSNNDLVDVEDVDLTFFIATVDLWSEDGTKEMNLVLNTSNSERHSHATPRRRRRASTSLSGTAFSPDSHDSEVTAYPYVASPIQEELNMPGTEYDNQPQLLESITSVDTVNSPVIPFTTHSPPAAMDTQPSLTYHTNPDPMSFNPSNPYGPPPSETPSSALWAYPTSSTVATHSEQLSPHQELRSIPISSSSSLHGANVDTAAYTANVQWEINEPVAELRREAYATTSASWDTYSNMSRPPATPHQTVGLTHSSNYSSQPLIPTWGGGSQSSLAGAVSHSFPASFSEQMSVARPSVPQSPLQGPQFLTPTSQDLQSNHHPEYAQAPSDIGAMSPSTSRYAPSVIPNHSISFEPSQVQFGYDRVPELSPQPEFLPSSNLPAVSTEALPLPRHTYIRTLVGPVASNSFRLLDEKKTLGNYFIFQDLSVRTEGTFRLRIRLMNIGMPPAPERGSFQINTGASRIIAQTFSEPFNVFSAKRFPGVPDNTPLSIAFADQGIKLPLRSKNGEAKKPRHRKRRHENPQGSSDDESQ